MPLLQVEDLTKTFKGREAFIGTSDFNAVENVKFSLERQQNFGDYRQKWFWEINVSKNDRGHYTAHFWQNFILTIMNCNLRISNTEHNIFEWCSKMRIQRLILA